MHQRLSITTLLLTLISFSLSSQTVKDFFYVEKESRELPMLVRGNLKNKIILLYVSGSYGDNAIDFARSDYPRWKNTLEKEVAIAYYDKRGLNKRLKKIDTTQISWDQNSKDLLSIIRFLKKQYKSKIYLMGHSAGGMLVLYHLSMYNALDNNPIEGAIMINTPFTTDSSPERYSQYRPQYLKNIAQDFIQKDINREKWQEALNWMTQTDSIHSLETSRTWNRYVDEAHAPQKRPIGPGMALRVVFSRPYCPFKILNNKDNDLVGDLLWAQKQQIRDKQFSQQLSRINHRTLVITGQYDPIAVPEELVPIKSALSEAETLVLPNCGHEAYLDQPELLNDAILKFIGNGL
ncbi:MAG: alpha/beta hydrolase [Ekhidna sp.]|nr:alpha/beta hydrolase [Ekhidna sp.]